MKMMIVGAGGRLGGTLVTKALDRGHDVTAVVRSSPCRDERARTLLRDLFDLKPADVQDADVILSAFGGGFKADPKINLEAVRQLAFLARSSQAHLILVGGAGCLYTDDKKETLVCQTEAHPDFLRAISMNLAHGLDELMKDSSFSWTFVCPALTLDFDKAGCGEYLTGTDRIVIVNEDKNSYVTSEDLALAMLDFAENQSYTRKVVTVVSKHGA